MLLCLYLQILNLMEKYKNNLFDDFILESVNTLPTSFLGIIDECSPYFWAIFKDEKESKNLMDSGFEGLTKEEIEKNFAGFIYFSNTIKIPSKCNPDKLFSACVTICLKGKFFGSFSRKIALEFFAKSLKKFEYKKITAQIFSSNPSAVRLLGDIGFIEEGNLKNHTIVKGKSVDMRLFSLFA